MSYISYHSTYGYASKIDEERLFKTKESAAAYDREEAIKAVTLLSAEVAANALDPKFDLTRLRTAFNHYAALADEAEQQNERSKYQTPAPVPEAFPVALVSEEETVF